MIMGWTFQNS